MPSKTKVKVAKDEKGRYVINGKTYKLLIGSRAQVWHETAYKTSGGLLISDLIQNKHGDIVSKIKHMQESKDCNLQKYGFWYKKGVFGVVKKKPSEIKSKTARNKSIDYDDDDDDDATQSGGGGHFASYQSPNSLAYNAGTVGGKGRRHKRRGLTRRSKGGGGGEEGDSSSAPVFDPNTFVGGRSRSRARSAARSRSRAMGRSRSRSRMVAGGLADTAGLFLG
jgi:hypothetical protein